VFGESQKILVAQAHQEIEGALTKSSKEREGVFDGEIVVTGDRRTRHAASS